MTRNTTIVVVVVILLAILAPRVFSATILAIETHDCGVIHTRHESLSGPAVLMTKRGSRRYVCGAYPENPFAFDLYAKIPPEFVNEYPAPLATVASDTVSRRGSWQAGGTLPPLGVPPFTVVIHEPPRAPETPVETPAPVPAPAGLGLLLSALAGLYGLRRMKR